MWWFHLFISAGELHDACLQMSKVCVLRSLLYRFWSAVLGSMRLKAGLNLKVIYLREIQSSSSASEVPYRTVVDWHTIGSNFIAIACTMMLKRTAAHAWRYRHLHSHFLHAGQVTRAWLDWPAVIVSSAAITAGLLWYSFITTIYNDAVITATPENTSQSVWKTSTSWHVAIVPWRWVVLQVLIY